MYSTFIVLALALGATAGPMRRNGPTMRRGGRAMSRAAIDVANGNEAITLNNKFKTITAGSACTAPQDACAGDQFAQCVGGKFVAQSCAAGLVCAALPNIGSKGTSIACTTPGDVTARIAASGATGAVDTTTPATPPATTPADDGNTNNGNAGGAAGGGGDPQTSFTLDDKVIVKAFAQDGQAVQDPGQVPSLTSTNNYINFCLTTGQTLHDGTQQEGGSCNPAPMGSIPAKAKIPASKFVFPTNQEQIKQKTPFDVKMKISNIQTGNFVNAKLSYYNAPQQLNNDGIIIGHSHFVIEKVASLKSTDILDVLDFAFFKGVNTPADANGILTVPVTDGLPIGIYRLASINAAANHQPVLAPIAQHGSLDDMVYFEVVA